MEAVRERHGGGVGARVDARELQAGGAGGLRSDAAGGPGLGRGEEGAVEPCAVVEERAVVGDEVAGGRRAAEGPRGEAEGSGGLDEGELRGGAGGLVAAEVAEGEREGFERNVVNYWICKE